MAFFEKDEIYDIYVESKDEARQWREDYHEYERLADNDLIDDLDENLPEVNDGSLAASLFKLPKRIVNSKLEGRAKALDADDAWITELANIEWVNNIIPNANSQAPFHRKWKDAVRKAAIYGGQPIINLFVENGSYTGSDFIVPQAQDVTLEVGKVSDYDSQIIFWDVYYTKQQVRTMIEQAEAEDKEFGDVDGYNKWDIKALKEIVESKQEEDRPSDEEVNKKLDKGVKKSGIHFFIALQRGVEAPFYMFYTGAEGSKQKKEKVKCVREWSNPDPTGDVPIHYLYCYQDFQNPYGIGIVKLAGGTQNVLDYMRQADVLATQIGIRPPIAVAGNTSTTDFDSLVYAQDALWITGEAEVQKQELANGIYQELPNRISMYKTSLNQLIPTGDTSISSTAGDPNYSKTPAGVKFQAASLSIDDEDFKDNFYMTYAAVSKSMINTHFANMQGEDFMKLSDEERDLLMRAGLDFPVDEMGSPTNDLQVIWDEARATFDFEVDPEADKSKDDEQRLEGLKQVSEFIKDPAVMQLIGTGQPLILGTKKIDPGELIAEMIALATDNDKIIQDVTPEDQEAMAAEDQLMQEEQMAAEEEALMQEQAPPEEQLAPQEGLPMELPEQAGEEGGQVSMDVTPEQAAQNVQLVMEQMGVDQQTAALILEADRQGFDADEIMSALERQRGVMNV